VVERIVAVVGDKAILLTDLRKRARPFLANLYQRTQAGPQRAAAESQILGQIIQRMVDDELEALAAARAQVTVNVEDVDQQIQAMASAARLGLSRFLREVQANSGMTELEYRQEIRRQLLEGKLLVRLTQNRFRITEKEVEEMYAKMVRKERTLRLYHPAWLLLYVGKNPSNEALADRLALARQIVEQVRTGAADFTDLTEKYSVDTATRDIGGDLGIRAPTMSPAAMTGRRSVLAPPLEKACLKLEPGQVSEPLRFKRYVVVLKLLSRQPSRFKGYAKARGEMIRYVKAEKMQKVKVKWLKDLRRRTHVDVRW